MPAPVSSPLPPWAQAVRRKYTAGEASLFLLHGNVFDQVLHKDQLLSLPDFLISVLLWDHKSNIALLDPSRGLQVVKSSAGTSPVLPTIDDPADITPGTWRSLEQRFYHHDGHALIITYAGHFFPDAPVHFLAPSDRAAQVTIHRWSLSQQLAARDNIVFLVAESPSELSQALVTNPGLAAVEIPLPDQADRAAVIRRCNPGFTAAQVEQLAEHAAGLRAIQLTTIFRPHPESGGLEAGERRHFILSLLQGQPDAQARADKLAALTAGMTREDIRHLLNPDAPLPETERRDPLAEMLELLRARKREIIEKQCAGLIEFIDSKHGLEAVGGLEGVKQELQAVAEAVRRNDTPRIPMGLMFVGAMGTGKTFVAKAFARTARLPAIALKNFRDRWVGSTEANLERVLTLVKALGPIILIIDEGDRAFGAEAGETDGGTSSRVMARLKAFMSDPDNRGRVLFIVMTNRPDKLDTDLKRAGRLDRKIPFFYPQDEAAVAAILTAILGRHRIAHAWREDEDGYRNVLKTLIGYSSADLEAVALLAHNLAAGKPVDTRHLELAVADYLPSRDTRMIEYMELLAVFEASRRSLLPARYADLSAAELTRQLAEKRRLLRI